MAHLYVNLPNIQTASRLNVSDMLELKSADFDSHSKKIGDKYHVTVKHIPTGRTESSIGDNRLTVKQRLMDTLLISLLADRAI